MVTFWIVMRQNGCHACPCRSAGTRPSGRSWTRAHSTSWFRCQWCVIRPMRRRTGSRAGPEFRYDAVQDPEQAQKLMRLELNMTRRQGVFTAPFNWRAKKVRIWDCVTLTFPRLGFAEKIFRVIEKKTDPMGAIWLLLREDDPSIYTPGTVLPVPPPAEGAGYDPRVVTAPDAGDWSVTPGYREGEGTRVPVQIVAGGAPASNIVAVHVYHGPSATGPWTYQGRYTALGSVTVDTASIAPGATYYIQIFNENAYGVRSDPTVLGPYTSGSEFISRTTLDAEPGSVLSTRLEVIEAEVDDNASGLATKASIAYVDSANASEAAARAAADELLQSQITAHDGDLTTLDATATNLLSRMTAVDGGSAYGKTLATIEAEYAAADAAILGSSQSYTNAQVSAEASARASAIAAEAASRESLEVYVGTLEDRASFAATIGFDFNDGAQGWVVANAVLTEGDGFVVVDATTAQPYFYSPDLNVPGYMIEEIRIRCRRTDANAPSGYAGFQVNYTSELGSYPSNTSIAVNLLPVAGQDEWFEAVFTTDAAFRARSNIGLVRFRLGNDAGNVWQISEVSFGRRGFAGSAAAVHQNAGAVADINGSAAFWETVVAATGSDPAVVSLRAGREGSVIALASRIFRLINNVGSTTIEVMRAVGGYVFFSNPISIDVGGRRLTLAPNADQLLWFGADTIDPPDQTLANSRFSLRANGNGYYGGYEIGARSLSASHTGSYSDIRVGTGTRNTGSITINPTGGSGSYTYSHEIRITSNPNSVPVTLNNATSQTFSISAPSRSPVRWSNTS